ncbi:ATP-binding cassette domain-containing protein [Providencia rettgeri]|uniref:ATP-binding cassette domain-containing protein n=1 Tax=Providencia rettgeri TaxID=587 RepID=UPI0034E07DF9
MKPTSFHQTITNYFNALGEPFSPPSSSYDPKYVLNNINEFIVNQFFTYQYSEVIYDNTTTMPLLFIMEIHDDEYIIIKNKDGKFFNLTTNQKITESLLKSKRLFYFLACAKTLNQEKIYRSLINLTPKSTLFSLPLVIFALLLPLYSNLFNSRLVYSESIASLLYISIIFLFVVGLEFFIKHIIHEKNLQTIKLNIGIFNRYFVNLLRQTNCKSAAIKIRTAEASILQVWEIRPQIIYDIGLAILFTICICAMLGFYSLLLLTYYAGLIFLCLHIRFRSYKNMLRANNFNYEKSALYYSFEQKKSELNFINDIHFNHYVDQKTHEDEKIKLKLNEANHQWMEIIKTNTFLSMIVMYVACYLAVGSGTLSLVSIIAVLIINGRLSGAITGVINRIFLVKTHLFHIQNSVSQLTENTLPLFKQRGVLLDSVECFKAQHITLEIGGKKIVNQLNIDAQPGNIIGITGVSGSGKTSLIHALCGLSKQYSGEVTINDVKLQEIAHQFFQQNVAYHSGSSTFLNGSIRDNFNLHGVFDDREIIRITQLCCPKLPISQETLNDVLISDVQASTGEKQKLMLAITLLKKPKIIFLDESTSFMATHDALHFLTTIRKELGLEKSIIFFATHDLGLTPLFTQHIALSLSPVKRRVVSNSANPSHEVVLPKISLSR